MSDLPVASLRDLLSDAVAAVEIRPIEGRVDDSLLFDGERSLVERVAPGRFRDFVLGRRCARLATEALGLAPGPLLVGEHREPLWPEGVAGAITHCDGYVAAAVTTTGRVRGVGIDAEPDAPLPDGVERRIIRDDERALLELGDIGVRAIDRLVFSTKEAVYKTWYPLARRWLGFHEARIELVPDERRFVAHILVDGPCIDGKPLTVLHGRYASIGGTIITTIEVPPR